MSITRINPNEQPSSRYRNLVRFNDGDVAFVETPNKVNIPRSTRDEFHTVEDREKNRLDIIASRYYSDSRLWWVIAYASNILNPFDVPVGTVLRIPPYSTAMSDEVI